MRRLSLKVGLTLLILLIFATTITGQEPAKEQIITQLMMNSLANWHYTLKPINDQFSRQVFTLYLKNLDSNKRFLLRSDLENLQQYELQIDNQLNQGKQDFFNSAVNLFNKRIIEVQALTKELLANPFNLTEAESLEIDPEKRNYAKDPAELRDLWRKLLKLQILERYSEILANQEKESGTKLSLAEKQEFKPKIEAQAREEVAHNLNRSLQRILQESRESRFERYLNAIANSYDPHSEYFSPQGKEDFDIHLAGTLEGIGVMIGEDGDYIKVESIVPGGPAWRNKQLQAGDLILKVAQGNAEPVDVVSMSSSEAVKLIRGTKGTEVRLTVKKADGRVMVIAITRDIVLIEESFAKSAIITNRSNGKKIGYIYLPAFYHNPQNNRTAANDIKRELGKLKAEKVAGVIFDVRDNGGGVLTDAVGISGLFINKGPVLQVKDRNNQQDAQFDPSSGVAYDGPLVVMINSLSASASEIFAGAMQDYQRAVIVGGPSSFGKGTVQTFADLDDYLPKDYNYLKPLGSIKITIQKFYRVTGKSTQFEGVKADVPLPDTYSYAKIGEQNLDYPLPWDTVYGLPFQKWGQAPHLDALKQKSAKRIVASNSFKLVNQDIAKIKQKREATVESLQLAQFIAHQSTLQQEAEGIKKQQQDLPFLTVQLPKADQKAKNSDSILKKKTEEWLKQINQDVYLGEASFIIGDMLAP